MKAKTNKGVLFTDYLKKCVTPFHTVETSRLMLEEAGFFALPMNERWKIEKGGKYYCIPYASTIVAFTYAGPGRVHVAAAHTDHPCLHAKPHAELASNGYMRVNTEVYGSPILNTWFDRPLGIAGRVILKTRDVYAPMQRLFDTKRAVLTVPNLAIHYNRDVNKGVEISKQRDIPPLAGMIDEKINRDSFFTDFIEKETGVNKEEILDYDLYIYNTEAPEMVGFEGDMLSSPRIDNLTSCYALIKGITVAEPKEGLNIIALFDNEEIGSRTRQGADSALLPGIMERIYAGSGRDRIDMQTDMADGFLLSVDVAHALHPVKDDKYDKNNCMLMGEGVTFKLNVNQRYSYDSVAVASLMQLADKAGVKYGKFVNHADMPGGGTLGPIISSLLPMSVVDIGVPILAMHSARELMAESDEKDLITLLTAFMK